MDRHAHIAILPDRGLIAVTGADARAFLDNLLTNDMGVLDSEPAIHAALLTPQGKILFAFFVAADGDGFLIETARTQVADLIKRLYGDPIFYKNVCDRAFEKVQYYSRANAAKRFEEAVCL